MQLSYNLNNIAQPKLSVNVAVNRGIFLPEKEIGNEKSFLLLKVIKLIQHLRVCHLLIITSRELLTLMPPSLTHDDYTQNISLKVNSFLPKQISKLHQELTLSLLFHPRNKLEQNASIEECSQGKAHKISK